MSEQITWTHVDKLVRKMHDERGMLAIGLTDAEVAHAFIQWLARQNEKLFQNGTQLEQRCDSLGIQLMQAKNAPKSKTKQRLHDLEAAVAELQKQPMHPPFAIVRCANKHCLSKAREISPYCEKCEPDL